MSHLIAPSILAADFSQLGKAITLIDESEAAMVHIDVMDGRFVPNISFGFPVIKAVRHLTKKPFDVHLMIVEPDKYLENFKQVGADILTVHYEACTHLHRTLQAIKALKMKAGVALNPHTPIHCLEAIIEEVDLVCLMSVNPGFGGQHFIENTLKRIRQLRQLISESGSKAVIEIDGGVSLKNAADIVEAGANILVAGSSVFKAENPKEAIRALRGVR